MAGRQTAEARGGVKGRENECKVRFKRQRAAEKRWPASLKGGKIRLGIKIGHVVAPEKICDVIHDRSQKSKWLKSFQILAC